MTTPIKQPVLTRKILGALLVGALAALTTVTLYFTLGGNGQPATPAPAADPKPTTFIIRGTLDVYGGCGMGYGGFADLAGGSQVVVFDSHRSVIGTGVLEVFPTEGCGFEFTIPNVPAGMDRYGVQVGNQNRGVIWKSEAEARDGYALSIGK